MLEITPLNVANHCYTDSNWPTTFHTWFVLQHIQLSLLDMAAPPSKRLNTYNDDSVGWMNAYCQGFINTCVTIWNWLKDICLNVFSSAECLCFDWLCVSNPLCSLDESRMLWNGHLSHICCWLRSCLAVFLWTDHKADMETLSLN